MMVKKSYVLLLFLAGAAFGDQTVVVNEAALPALVEKNNSQVLAAQQRWESADVRRRHIRRSFLPEMAAVAGAETFKTGVENQRDEPFGSVGAEVNLFRGGRDSLEEEARGAQARQAEMAYRQVVAVELVKARQLYWEAVFSREMLTIFDATLKRNEEMLVSAKRRIQGGLATETDRYEFEMNRTQLEQDRMRLKLTAQRAERKLKAHLGMSDTVPLQTPDQIPHEHEDALVKTAWDAEASPETQTIIYESQAASAASRQTRRWWTPSVDLYGNYSLYTFREREYDAQQDRNESVAGARLSLPFFDGFRSRSNARAQSLASDALKNQAIQTTRDRQADFQSAKEELSLLHDLIHSAEAAVEQGHKYLAGTRSEYTRGVKNSPDVLGAMQKNLELERRYADIRRDYQFVKADLLYLLGR